MPRRLVQEVRKPDKCGAEALSDGVVARALGVGVVRGGYSDGSVDAMKDASPVGLDCVVAEEIEVCVQRGVHVQQFLCSFG